MHPVDDIMLNDLEKIGNSYSLGKTSACHRVWENHEDPWTYHTGEDFRSLVTLGILAYPLFVTSTIKKGFPDSSVGKESTCNAAGPASIPGSGRSAAEGIRLPTPVFWPGEFHGLYSPWGLKESDTTEWLSLYFPHLKLRKKPSNC